MQIGLAQRRAPFRERKGTPTILAAIAEIQARTYALPPRDQTDQSVPVDQRRGGLFPVPQHSSVIHIGRADYQYGAGDHALNEPHFLNSDIAIIVVSIPTVDPKLRQGRGDAVAIKNPR
jgi:hypothetical protein